MTLPDVPEKTEAIEKCPWCGGEPTCEIVHYGHGGGRNGVGYRNVRVVQCLCGAKGKYEFERAETIAAWNSVARLRERVAACEAIVRDLVDMANMAPGCKNYNAVVDIARAALRETEAKEGKDGA